MLKNNNVEEKKLFVYGSLRHGFFNYDKYLKGHVVDSKLGKIKGKLYHMPNKGYPAVIDGNDDVYGELISIKDFHKNLTALDKMEGFISENNPENEYNRLVMQIEIPEENKTEEAYVYIYNLEHHDDFKSNAEYVNHGDWKKHMK